MDFAIAILGMLLLGGGVGILSAALGVGGGILMVPAFTSFISGMDMNTAKGSSLLVIVFIAAVNSWRMNRGVTKSPWVVVGLLALGGIFGGYLGAFITGRMNDLHVTLAFITLLAFAGVRTLFLKQRIVHEDDVRRHQYLAILIGLATGFVAGATGTGGGAVFVPFVLWAGICSNERVVALSNTVMVATAAASTLGHFLSAQTVDMPYTFGQVNLGLVPIVLLGAVLTAPLGRIVNKHLSLDRRRIIMGGMLLLITARLLYRMAG